MKNLLIGIGLGLAVAGCGSSPNKPSQYAKVEYNVTGSASRASMTYATSNGGTSQQGDRTLPWSFSTTMSAGEFVYLSAQNSGQSGCVNVEIRVRSQYYKSTQSCGAFVIATVSGTVE